LESKKHETPKSNECLKNEKSPNLVRFLVPPETSSAEFAAAFQEFRLKARVEYLAAKASARKA
jgi:hypothetical protein